MDTYMTIIFLWMIGMSVSPPKTPVQKIMAFVLVILAVIAYCK